ncbi:MAG: hypothetical protein V2A76_19095 [Planctomycetota bacterium]
MSTAESLSSYLRRNDLPVFEYDHELTEQFLIPMLMRLGYTQEHVFLDYTIAGTPHRPDLFIAETRTSRPHMLMEVRTPRRDHETALKAALEKACICRDATNGNVAAAITPMSIGFDTGRKKFLSSFSELSTEQAAEMAEHLKTPWIGPPPDEPGWESDDSLVAIASEDEVETREQLTRFGNLLVRILTAPSEIERTKALDLFVKRVLEGVPFLHCKYSNLLAVTCDLDVVLEYRPLGHRTLFDDTGRYTLLECSYWARPLDGKSVLQFQAKLQRTRTRLGILFSRNGVTGAYPGLDAQKKIRTAHERDGISILVISEEDLLAMAQGTCFHDLVDAKLDRLRFHIR